ncbi:signal peptidase I [Isoptericola sp. NPDC019693]|uniref:signal peptidase I n=1 Tax=Isoptericola sp. NPDC019693 TaxID=3364009 RepID=UPI0037ACEAA7
MRALRFLQSTLLNVAAVVGGLCIVVVLACLATGLRPAIVVSGSMAPGIPVGAMTFARTTPADELQVGDVVTLPRTDGRGLVTHRITAIDELPDEVVDPAGTGAALTLRGDANEYEDPRPYHVATVGKVAFDVPYLGALAGWLQTHVLLVAGILVGLTVVVMLPSGTGRRAAPADADAPDPAVAERTPAGSGAS